MVKRDHFFALALGAIAFAQFVHNTIGKKIINLFKPRDNNTARNGHDYVDPRLTNNPIYPQLPKVNVPMQQFTRPLAPLPVPVNTSLPMAPASVSPVPMGVVGSMPVGVAIPAGATVPHGEAAMPTVGPAHSAVGIQ